MNSALRREGGGRSGSAPEEKVRIGNDEYLRQTDPHWDLSFAVGALDRQCRSWSRKKTEAARQCDSLKLSQCRGYDTELNACVCEQSKRNKSEQPLGPDVELQFDCPLHDRTLFALELRVRFDFGADSSVRSVH